MSPQQQDAGSTARSRQRSNTTSLTAWLRQKPETHTSPPSHASSTNQPLALGALLEALKPPAVPSLAHARTLAALLTNASPLPRTSVLNPVISSLCDVNHPLSFQAAGFEVLSSYWENPEATVLETADRLSFISLFLGSTTPWAKDIWEPRFKALRALTKSGTDIIGIESGLIGVVKWWIEGAFEGIICRDAEQDRTERSEREKSVAVLVKFLFDILIKPENIARFSDDTIPSVLQFYAGLVNRSIITPASPYGSKYVSASTDSLVSTSQKFGLHRRNLSSLSTTSLTSPTTPVPLSSQTPYKQPIEIAIPIYLDYLHAQIKILSPPILRDTLPLLFRALASCASPLPRLSVLSQPHRKSTLEDRILETLTSIFTGPYSTTCVGILKRCLYPEFDEVDDVLSDANEAPGQTVDDDNCSVGPQTIPWVPLQLGVFTSLGAFRLVRSRIRYVLTARLARAYILRESSVGYSYTGAPSHIELEQDIIEKAWPRDDFMPNTGIGLGVGGWDARRLGPAVAESIAFWVDWIGEGPHTPVITQSDSETFKRNWDREREKADQILEEAAGLLKDILQEADSREDDNPGLSDEEASFVGEALMSLCKYIPSLRQGLNKWSADGSPFNVPLDNPSSAPTPLLKSITSLLARDHTTNMNPPLSTILILIAENLTDKDTARLPAFMLEQHELSPTSPEWLSSWERLLSNTTAVSSRRPLTKCAMLEVLAAVYDSVKEMPSYRRPLADLVLKLCISWVGKPEVESEDGDTLWKILGEEIMFRATEQDPGVQEMNKLIDLLRTVALEPSVEEVEDMADAQSALSAETQTPSPSIGMSMTPSNLVSPILSRMQSEIHNIGKDKDKDSTIPSVMSLLSSFTSSGASRSHSSPPPIADDVPEPSPEAEKRKTLPRVVSAVSAIVNTFSQLAFTPHVLEDHLHRLAIRLFQVLIDILAQSQSARGRVTVLQFLMRLRADRDHGIFFISETYDKDNHIALLSGLINRSSLPSLERNIEDTDDDYVDPRRSRPRLAQEREERQTSRGRGGGLARTTGSRSRSRAPPRISHPEITRKLRPPLWHYPETLPFTIAGVNTTSEALISYDSEGSETRIVLGVSQYLKAIIGILEKETSWDVLSYVLCHLPTQLSNKHFFCGPLCRQLISRLLNVLCSGILSGELGFYVEAWPPGLKPRDAQGLVHHCLSVLISYRWCFETHQRHVLVEVFQHGLDGQLSTIKCSLHALTLAAFELRSSVTKCMPRILEKLSQIMSNPNMSVHILAFLSIVGSLPPLYANFTESDYKMVFGVALQYLQHYNRHNFSPTISWALSQYVRIMSYTTVYIWFLALKLPDRPKHIPYITRQLMLANESNQGLDIPTEVCFDWLARFAYASADPRPATSSFSEVVMNPSNHPPESGSPEVLHPIKSWLMGNAVVTVNALPRAGWVEVLSRRPSGFTKLVCHVENVPMIGPGDVSPDFSSVTAGLMLNRTPVRVISSTGAPEETKKVVVEEELQKTLELHFEDDPSSPARPDPITGYVWSRTAPSQRRKDVVFDPSYIPLQLSSYPFKDPNVRKLDDDGATLRRFLSTLDRIPVIDTHKVGIMYVAPGQTDELEILGNTHGSPAYTRFLEGLGRLINLRGQVDVYAGGLDPDEDGEYAYAWWDDIGQILYHTATMMPSHPDHDPSFNYKKRHIGNDYVRIVWNDSGKPYRFDTLTTQFQFVNLVIEPHSLGAIAAFSNDQHENEYFKVTIQRAPGMTEFTPLGCFKLISAENLPLLVRQLSLLADWFTSVFAQTQMDTQRVEVKTNWSARLEAIRRFKSQLPPEQEIESPDGIFVQEAARDFTNNY